MSIGLMIPGLLGSLQTIQIIGHREPTLEELKENLTDIYNQVNDPEAFPSGSVHNELSLGDVPENHKTDELLIEV